MMIIIKIRELVLKRIIQFYSPIGKCKDLDNRATVCSSGVGTSGNLRQSV